LFKCIYNFIQMVRHCRKMPFAWVKSSLAAWDGDTMEPDMPRWQMSDHDLADLLAFLETITQKHHQPVFSICLIIGPKLVNNRAHIYW